MFMCSHITNFNIEILTIRTAELAGVEFEQLQHAEFQLREC